jgi:hypothetical protein
VSDPEIHRLAVALEALNGTMSTGFASVRGEIQLLARGEHQNGEDIDKLDERVGRLEERRWPLQITQGIMSVAAVAVAGYAALNKG